jgi:uncharacterized protein (DUF433 family)
MQPSSQAEIVEVLAMPRIVRTPGTCGGQPRIEGHRIKVAHVAICHERLGMSPEDLVRRYPSLTLAQVYAALAYYFDHKDEIDADIREDERYVETLKAMSLPSRLQAILKGDAEHAPHDPISS